MKKLIIDLSSTQPACGIQTTGGGMYAEKMFYELYNRYGTDVLVVMLDARRGENKIINDFIKNKNICVNIYHDFNQMSEIINKHNSDVIFLPICYPEFHALNINGNPNIVTTIHDLSSVYELNCRLTREKLIVNKVSKEILKYSLLHNFVLNRHIRRHIEITSFGCNQIIITDSNYSKDQMLKYLNLADDQPIYVFYPLLFEDENIKVPAIKDELCEKKFFFFVSANRWHKNNYFAVSAIDEAITRGNNYLKSLKYVVTGLSEKHMNFYKKHIKNKECFIFKGFIEREEYNYYMKNALAMVYPSLFEGFGAPPIEAMRYGTVALCSNATCIPEISGDAAIYYDPYNKKEFIDAATKTSDKELMNELSCKSKKRYFDILERQNRDKEEMLTLFDGLLNNG